MLMQVRKRVVLKLLPRVTLALLVVLGAGCGSPQSGEDSDTAPSGSAPVEGAQADAGDSVGDPVNYDPLPLPEGLEWQTNLDDEPFASPDAIRGGTFRSALLSFPLTLRLVGPDSNGAFAGVLRPNHLLLVNFHPNTGNPIPVLATHWAFGEDGRTVFYRLNPRVRWSDGKPVTADDYVFTLEFNRSRHIVAPWYNNQYTNEIVDVRKHGDDVIAVTGRSAKPPREMLFEYGYRPTPKHFHVLNKDWVRDYNWKIEPNTGPYQISEVRKGKYIEFERVEDWWGDDEKYFRHRFNPSKLRYTVIRDLNVAWEHFLKGDIDTFALTVPHYWHEKATGPEFTNGYIRKYWFYNDREQPAGGMWLNTSDPLLADRNIRLGLAHSMNFQKVIDTILRGDYARMRTHHEGYGAYTNHDIQPRAFDVGKADEYFDAAGWSKRGSDGIREKDGQRLTFRVIYGAPTHTERLVVLKEEAKKAGVELVLQLTDGANSFKQIQEKNHQIGWMTWAGGGIIPRFWEFYHTDNAHKTQTNNTTNFSDPQMDALIDRYRASRSTEERVAIAHEMEQMVHDSGVLIPTFKVPFVRQGAWRWLRLPEHRGTRKSPSLFDPLPSTGLVTYQTGGLFWIDPELKQQTLDAKKRGESFTAEPIIDKRYLTE